MHESMARRVMHVLAELEPAMAVFWLALAVFTVALGVLLYTRWGQYRPLRKCMVLSLLVHLMLVCYATTVQIVATSPRPADPIRVSLGNNAIDQCGGAAKTPKVAVSKEQPWEVFSDDAVTRPEADTLRRGDADAPLEPKPDAKSSAAGLLDRVALAEAKPLPTARSSRPPKHAAPAEGRAKLTAPAAEHRDAPTLSLDAAPLEQSDADPPSLAARSPTDAGRLELAEPGETSQMPTPSFASASGRGSPAWVKPFGRDGGAGEPTAARATPTTVPEAYRLRVAPDRNEVAQSRGGSVAAEAAVKAALRWLADNQSADGHWDPKAHGGGKETSVQGRDRGGAGGSADTGMTGLALLAFLASGQTHLDGSYRDDVRRGLEYLLRIQGADGNLGGPAATYEFMYCHGMAACALSEAYGMTRDDRLGEPVRRAVDYTLRAQDPIGGGWRYKPGDAGDTSQLGWQLMAIKSAELAGIPIPEKTRQGAIRYLQSVASGKSGGRASYRPGEQVTRSMTAEALFCWQVLGLPRNHPAGNEAADLLMGEIPGEGVNNVYYWYYATLSMCQMQDAHWQRWNEALQATLVERQTKSGRDAGSWHMNDLWGGAGGRVFTTALATLTLEVYYRFLPLYVEVAHTDRQVR